MIEFTKAPDPPYYAVIFTSVLRDNAAPGYEAMADAMLALAQKQPGYLGVETARDENGLGFTVSFWQDEASIKAWKAVADHRVAQTKGKSDWYAWFHVRVAKVERSYSFNRDED